jgi:hypothetical protein
MRTFGLPAGLTVAGCFLSKSYVYPSLFTGLDLTWLRLAWLDTNGGPSLKLSVDVKLPHVSSGRECQATEFQYESCVKWCPWAYPRRSADLKLANGHNGALS